MLYLDYCAQLAVYFLVLVVSRAPCLFLASFVYLRKFIISFPESAYLLSVFSMLIFPNSFFPYPGAFLNFSTYFPAFRQLLYFLVYFDRFDFYLFIPVNFDLFL